MKLKYGSAASGIEAASVAWNPLGWEALWFSEIEPVPCAVLEHQWPGVPNLGDMTKLDENERFNDSEIDLLVAGTPCQSFSVAGLRGGLDDPRGNLTLHLLKLLDCKRPRWFVWENVPGVFSSWSDAPDDLPLPGPDDPPRYGAVVQRNDLDTFIHGLEKLGYGVARRVFDAQYFDLAQRRARVFVVGYLGDWRPAAAVLFERHGLSGNPPPRREKGQEVAGTIGDSVKDGGWGHNLDICGAHIVSANGGSHRMDFEPETFVVKGSAIGRKLENGPQRGEILDDGSCFALDTKEPHAVVAPLTGDPYSDNASEESKLIAFHPRQDPDVSGDISHPIGAMDKGCAVALRGRDGGSSHAHVLNEMVVRRLTPRECERLQGFPDDYTLIPNYRKKMKESEIVEMAAYLGIDLDEAREIGATPDGPRYKALGNSMAVPVMRWIGERIAMVDAMVNKKESVK